MPYLHIIDEAQAAGKAAGEALNKGDKRLADLWQGYAFRLYRSVAPSVAAEARRAFREGYREAIGYNICEEVA